jgi:hypothetical protein
MTLRTLFASSCALAVLALSACSTPSEPTPTRAADEAEPAAPPTVSDEAEQDRTVTPPDDWIDTRVDDARDRLQATEAGELVWQSIEAHGGLERWFANGPLFFHFDYRPLSEAKTVRDTYQLVDTWSSRAVHEMAEDRDVRFGWTGQEAWIHPAKADLDINARFWALTPYYFIGMPFVLADSGVNLERLDDQQLLGETYQMVKVTFEDEAGDAPDDYYVMYFNPDTHKVRALRYVVSYPGFFPDGGHSDEKLMLFEGEQTVEGITFAEHFPTHAWDAEAGEPGDKVTAIELTDVEFRPETEADFFELPSGAEVVEGY